MNYHEFFRLYDYFRTRISRMILIYHEFANFFFSTDFRDFKDLLRTPVFYLYGLKDFKDLMDFIDFSDFGTHLLHAKVL